MLLIDNNLDLYPIFNNIKEPCKKEIFDLINFLKTNPNLEDFKAYKISKESIEIFSVALDELLKKLKY